MSRRPASVWLSLALLAAMMLVAGCSSLPRLPTVVEDGYRGLRELPAPTAERKRADQTVLDAFFAAYGIELGEGEVEKIIRPGSLQGKIVSTALRRVAKAHGVLPVVVKADDTYLWDALADGEALLLVMPATKGYSASAPLAIPVAWNREEGWIELYGPDPSEAPTRISSFEFFSRRHPLSHAAMKLCLPKDFAKGFQADRTSQMVLADFWFDKGDYRRAEALYASISEQDVPGDAQGLVGRANVLVKRGRPADAAALYRKALELEPDSPKIHNNLAYALLQSGDGLMTALRHATTARDADPANPIYLETVGSIHLALGDPQRAAKTLEYAWGRSLRHPENVQVAIMDQLTRAWLAAGNEVLAWQVASYRVQNHPTFRVPKDILRAFPALKKLERGAQPERLTVE